MRKPNCFVVGGTISLLARIHIPEIKRLFASPAQSWKIRGVEREERAFVNRFIKQAIAWNAFRLQRSYKLSPRDVFCLVLEIFEHITIGSLLGNAWLWFEKADGVGVVQAALEMQHVFLAQRGLFRQTLELGTQNCGLKFAETVIEADDSVMVLIGETGTAGVYVALNAFQIFEIVGDDRATFTGSDQLAGLKAESSEIAH